MSHCEVCELTKLLVLYREGITVTPVQSIQYMCYLEETVSFPRLCLENESQCKLALYTDKLALYK